MPATALFFVGAGHARDRVSEISPPVLKDRERCHWRGLCTQHTRAERPGAETGGDGLRELVVIEPTLRSDQDTHGARCITNRIERLRVACVQHQPRKFRPRREPDVQTAHRADLRHEGTATLLAGAHDHLPPMPHA